MDLNDSNRLKLLLYYLPALAVLVFLLGKSTVAPLGDFGNYYYASKFLLQGRWGEWIYEPAAFNLAIHEEGQRWFFLNYTPVPPASALFYAPFALFSPGMAKLVWNGINATLLLIALYRLQKHFNPDPRVLLLVPVLFFTPLRNTISEGQSYFLLLFLLSEGLIRYLQQQKWMAVLLWAIAIHLKVSPAFILLFLLFQKDWKASVQLVSCGVGMVLISLPFLGLQTWHQYAVDILPRLYQGEINNTYAMNYQSMQVLLKTLFVPDAMHNPNAWFNSPASYHRLLSLFHITVYGSVILCTFTKAKTEMKFGAWLMASLLVSGYGNSFSLLLLLLPVLCSYQAWKENRLRLVGMAVALLLIANTPLHAFAGLPVLFQFPRLFLLLGLFLLYVWPMKPRIKPYYAAVCALIFFVPVPAEIYRQNYLLPVEADILIYDFKLVENDIVLYTYNGTGPHQKKWPLPYKVWKAVKQQPANMVAGRERVPVSCLINDSVIVYLSDRNRGVGFYTLRYEKQ